MSELNWIGQNWGILSYFIGTIAALAIALYKITVLYRVVFNKDTGQLNFKTADEIDDLEYIVFENKKLCGRVENMESGYTELVNKFKDSSEQALLTERSHRAICEKEHLALELMIWTLLKSFKIELIRDLEKNTNQNKYNIPPG